MKKLLPTLLLFFALSNLKAQQLPNSGFETWLNLFGLEYPDYYLTSDMETLAGAVVKSTDAHSGTYSVQLISTYAPPDTTIVTDTLGNSDTLITVNSTAGGIISGVVTMTFQPVFGLPFTGRPDSISIWAKSNVFPNDTAAAQLLLTKKNAGDTTSHLVGVATIGFTGVSNWAKYTAAVEYLTAEIPDTVLFQAVSSIGDVIGNTTVNLDDIFLIYNNVGVADNAPAVVNIYPNPSNGIVNISGNDLVGATLTITDVTGRTIETIEMKHNTTIIHLQSKGVYFVTATKPNGATVVRKTLVVD